MKSQTAKQAEDKRTLSLFAEHKRLMSTVHFASNFKADYTSDNAIAGIAWYFR